MKIIEVEAETLKLGYILNIIPYNYYVLLYTGTGNIFKTGSHCVAQAVLCYSLSSKCGDYECNQQSIKQVLNVKIIHDMEFEI